MRIVGVERGAGVEVASLSEDGRSVAVLARLEEFWSAPEASLTSDSGEVVPVAEVRLVPPVLPGARVICIGLNYLKHVAEGSYRDQELPQHPTLFGRWTRSLLATGTPAGVGYARMPPWLLGPGDVVEVEVDRLGVLRNPIVGPDHRLSRPA